MLPLPPHQPRRSSAALRTASHRPAGQPHPVPQLADLAGSVVGPGAGLHGDHTRRLGRDEPALLSPERGTSGTSQPRLHSPRALGRRGWICPVRSLSPAPGTPSPVVGQRLHLGTQMPPAGIHSINVPTGAAQGGAEARSSSPIRESGCCPSSTRRQFAAARRRATSRQPRMDAELCGEPMTFGRSMNG
jgi:hypothetical protein